MNARALAMMSGVVIMLGAVAAALAAAPSSTAFTYQGELKQGGELAEGVFDLALELYDLPTDGSLLARVELAGVEVRDGAFTVVVDFGLPLPGCGVNRFLETHVRPAGGGEYTKLSPRQPLKSKVDCTVDGTLTVTAMLELPATATSGGVPTAGVIYVADDPFLHSYGSDNTFLGANAGNFNMTGGGNTATGATSLLANTTGMGNTALGASSMRDNAEGSVNTAVGSASMFLNTDGMFNTAVGGLSLQSNETGDGNTAVGATSLQNSTGSNNTALGAGAGSALTTGDNNILLGAGAGSALTSGSDNIYIGTAGDTSDLGVIRVGTHGVHHFTIIPSISNVYVSVGNPVYATAEGLLGVHTSSIRFKQDVQDMGDASSRLLALRPVTFHYKEQPEGPLQYGLIAEEVEQVMPELVVRDADGQSASVAYHEMPAMLLNELQKQQAQIEELRRMVQALIDERSAAEARE